MCLSSFFEVSACPTPSVMLNGLRSYSIPLWLRISSAASAAARSSDYEALSSRLMNVVVCAALMLYCANEILPFS